MNKISNSNDNYGMLDDYSEILEENWSKVVRGKYSRRYPKDRQPVVRITDSDGVRYVKLRQFEAQALITPDCKLTAKLDSDVTPGEYQATLIIEEPTNPLPLEATAEINGEEENRPLA